jgi:hypothetical protein
MTTTDADDLKAKLDGDNEPMKEAIYSGPCSICGDTNYPLSFGGSSICPSCDCGDYGITKVQRQGKRIAELTKQVNDWCELWTKENEQRVEIQVETESLRERLAKAEGRATAAETQAAQAHTAADAYGQELAEEPLERALIEWAAQERIIYGGQRDYRDLNMCQFCRATGFQGQAVTHKPDCLHLLAKAHRNRLAAATAPQEGGQ